MTLQLQIVRKKLTPDEIVSPTIRWDEDCDCVQQTPDGGDTWVDVPGQDPRKGDGFRLPPLTTDDPRCDAAANMVAYLHKLIDIDLLAATNWTLASSLLATLLLVFPGGVFVDLLLIVADVILTIGSSAISTAFTSDVYDGLLCIYDNHLDAEGQMTSDDLAAIADDIGAQYPGTVYDVWFAHNRFLLENGWNNAGASGSETGDCSECATCFDFDFTISDWGFTRLEDVLDVPSAMYVDGVGWQTTYVQFSGSNGYRRVAITGLFPSTRITSFVVEYTFVPGVLDNTGDVNFCYGMTDSTISEPYFQQNLTLEIPNPLVSEYDPFTDINHIELNLYSGAYDHVTADPGGQITITRIYAVCP